MADSGQTLRNPVTHQDLMFRRTSAETGGEVFEVESTWAQPGSEPVEHFHPHQEERFEVLEGRLEARVGGAEHELVQGDSLVIPAGTPHSMWNPGPGPARASWETRPALRTEEFFETTWGLAAAGKVNHRGVPDLLQSAVLLREYRGEFRLTKPPEAVQRIVFGLLAPAGRLLGRTARQPR